MAEQNQRRLDRIGSICVTLVSGVFVPAKGKKLKEVNKKSKKSKKLAELLPLLESQKTRGNHCLQLGDLGVLLS